jgi:hypothetical protein
LITPCSGPAGAEVAIFGTNLLKSSGTTTTAPVGGDVRFAPYTATATHTGAPETPKQLSVVVPPDAIDGSIRVSTFNDVLGEGPFSARPSSCRRRTSAARPPTTREASR